MKKFAKTTAPSRSPAAFAPATVLTRKILNGISGSFARVSITQKTSSSTTATASRVSVQPEPQPWAGALETA